jgi:Domain of unknown function (DUF3854)
VNVRRFAMRENGNMEGRPPIAISCAEHRDAAPRASWTNLRPPEATLAEHHGDYVAVRGVTDEARDARGYWTARSGAAIPPEFSRGLRYGKLGGETLVIPLRSPDGKTTSHLIRHDRPKPDRKGRTRKFLNPGKSPDRPTNILDVPPLVFDAVQDPGVPLHITEGPLKGDALASWERAVLVIAGVENWHLKGGAPLRCWDHVPLTGRLVFITFDADHRTKENVQRAEAKLTAFLESRGARVLIVDVEPVDGKEETGVDDWIGRHGDPARLEDAARPFVPVDVGRERVSRDEKLRRLVAELWRAVRGLEMRKPGECTAVLVAREYVRAVERHGKLTAGGAKVHPSRRQIAENINVGLQSVHKAVGYLEGICFMEALDEPRAAHEAAAYLVKYPVGVRALGEHMEEVSHPPSNEEEQSPRVSSLAERDLYPGVHLMHVSLTGQTGPPPDMPNLRYPKLIHTWERKGGKRVVVDSEYFWRYGPKRGEIIRYVLERGCVEVAELREKFGSRTSRPGRFFETWVKRMLDDGVFVGDFESVEAAHDWREALERVRARTDEDEDNRRQRERYAQNRRDYLARLAGEKAGIVPEPEPTPELAGPERTAEILAVAEKRDHAARVEEQRRKVGTTPETFLADALEGNSGFGWRELRALWIGKGGVPEDLRRAVKHPYRFNREGGKGALYVERRTESTDSVSVPDHEPAPVAVLRETENLTKPDISPAAPIPPNLKKPEGEGPPTEDWRSHPLACECPDCAAPMPTYARAWSGV